MFSNSKIALITLIILSAMLPLAAFSAGVLPEKSVEIHLDPEVKVGSDELVLGDVATIYARSLAHFRALSALVLSRIPEDKEELRLPVSYLEARVRAVLPAEVDFALRAPSDIVFRRERIGLTGQELVAEISRLGRIAGKIPEYVETEIVPITGLEHLSGWKLASTSIEPQAEMQRWKGDVSFKLTRVESGKPEAVWVRTKVRWFQKAWVANRSLSPGMLLSSAQFKEKRVETTSLREEPVSVPPEKLGELLVSSRLRRSVVAENALLPSMLDRKPDAMPGKSLRVVFVSESGVRVSADGALVSPGSIGNDVKARLRTSKKIVTGKLVSQGMVEVSL